jgi:hypothetical protein
LVVLFEGGRTRPAAPLKVKEKESIEAPIHRMVIQVIKTAKIIYCLFLENPQRVYLSESPFYIGFSLVRR